MIQKKVRALSEFQFRTAEVEKFFVEGEVATIFFKNKLAFQNFIEKGLFEEAFENTPEGVPNIPIINPVIINKEEVNPVVVDPVIVNKEDELEVSGLLLSANINPEEPEEEKSKELSEDIVLTEEVSTHAEVASQENVHTLEEWIEMPSRREALENPEENLENQVSPSELFGLGWSRSADCGNEKIKIS